ncbi:MAG TPA: hypothetical protein VFC23_10870 [Thermoanaerobaculia bacterium]|nr:hypothetical protein [Thermoanaerobaculia bacterium]
MTLVELLTELTGAELVLRREEDMLMVAVLATSAGRRVLAMERTYRDGIHVLLDPTEEEVEMARSGDLWQLWNESRAEYLSSVIGLPSDIF